MFEEKRLYFWINFGLHGFIENQETIFWNFKSESCGEFDVTWGKILARCTV
jgi:hypothetical protein